MLHQSLDSTPLCLHFEQLVAFAVKNGTSRSFAAVFRVMRNILESRFPINAIQIVLLNTVGLGARHPVCLPHIVDFLKHVGSNQPEQFSEAITLGLVDAFDETDTTLFLMPHMEHLIQFFTESTLYQYEFCQPRMILRIIRRGLEENNSCGSGVEILELCQALIRNQDYEIFQPELKTVLSLVETSNVESDVKQRAWMLRSLITHLKDAFDADMDLSSTGKIENTDYSLIFMKVLFDYKIANAITGLKIDFIVDPKFGRAESIYIPVLEINQVRKACLQVHPMACSAVTIDSRVVMTTTDGRIFLSKLDPIHLKLEHFLSPLSSTASFSELWDRLTNQSDKCYSSALFLPRPDQLLQAIEYGELERFQMTKKKPTELAMVTPDSFLVLVHILSVKNSWNAEILVEDPSVLPVIHSLLIEYST
ncbi:hypothetical protein DAPPUDRAFT_264985 [Daphnia pulex]|uniref:AP5B1 middle domain-containing protein n=1 Tax=Daphnia pulex TaxID=6669 RepID=E9HSP2_DAPPU|nr:hypothetical protein DAPPUDRAFT_264985 [Daphnia pulex]|eukprot:EFX65242.1 hypothetical protein DAPPUDRAFT_264985 [Daphnia pulex]